MGGGGSFLHFFLKGWLYSNCFIKNKFNMLSNTKKVHFAEVGIFSGDITSNITIILPKK